MRASDFESPQSPPWVDVEKWKRWIREQGCSIELGSRHNKTDGEVHYTIVYGNASFSLNANCYDSKYGWQESIDWIEERKE